jgi:uncharacterized protein (TIGR03790 family)
MGITRLITVMLAFASVPIDAAGADNEHEQDRVNKIGASELAVIVNDADPTSVRIAEHYKYRRRIPEGNIIHVRFTPGGSTMSRAEFQRIKTEVDRATPDYVQVYALAWTQPYRVECMSITTAFAAGFDEGFCAKACGPTKPSPYFNSNSRRPYDDYGLRPAMMLAGRNFREVKKLIDRGVASDHTFPRGTGYLVSTSDRARNVRALFFPEIIERYMESPFDIRLVKADFIQNRKNVLFYFTGMLKVPAVDSIRFVPGAIADHLTSAGGDLASNSNQMSSLRWLEAGATGSYGTVSEPCNFVQKFPQPGIVIDRYLHGERLIEAYWKSVAWPGQGVFIGEPLAAPFRPDQERSGIYAMPEKEKDVIHALRRRQ